MEEQPLIVEDNVDEILVVFLSSQAHDIRLGPADLRCIAQRIDRSHPTAVTVLQVAGEVLERNASWNTTSPVTLSTWLSSALGLTTRTHSSQLPTLKTQLFNGKSDLTSEFGEVQGNTCSPTPIRLLCLQRCQNPTEVSMSMDSDLEHVFNEKRGAWKRYKLLNQLGLLMNHSTTTIMLFALSALLIFLTLDRVRLLGLIPGASSQWTTGLNTQLFLTADNVSEWKMEHNASHWKLRLDDQSMIPVALFDEREAGVQAWFETAFPLLKQNRDSGRYLDATYLEEWEEIVLDEKYHIAHCVAAIRRYLTAMETGRHICPKDVSLLHLKHCTKQLEDFAFRSNETWYPHRGRSIILKWHTDVCF